MSLHNNSPKDLGTYYVRVVLCNKRGWLNRWDTSAWYTGACASNGSGTAALDAVRKPPFWSSEDDLIYAVLHAYLDGSDACDCMKQFNLKVADTGMTRQEVLTSTLGEGFTCGDELKIESLTLIRPDGSEKVIYEFNDMRAEYDLASLARVRCDGGKTCGCEPVGGGGCQSTETGEPPIVLNPEQSKEFRKLLDE